MKIAQLAMKCIVVQVGARHRYAVARMLEQAGILEALYTDSHSGSLLGRAMSRLLSARQIGGLGQRHVLGVSKRRVYSTDLPTLLEPLVKRHSANWFEYYRRRDCIFSWRLKHWGLGEATAVYSMFGEGWDFVRWARAKGRQVVLDIFVNPVTHRIVEEERRRFPGWEDADRVDFRQLERDLEERFRLADLLLCPSQSVADGLRFYRSYSESKVRIVPYGWPVDCGGAVGEPVPGRVLFGGSADLRKGVQYLARAAELLGVPDKHLQIRVAGPVTDRVRRRPEVERLEFLGRLPRSEFLNELRVADVFVLPTLAEGSASVVYEAMACGVPVVTTVSAGSVITDGVEGRIVPERDAHALGDAIREIVLNRRLRTRMSEAALKTARAYGEDAWRERLLQALQCVVPRKA